jgi:hypothetical protein
LLSDRENILVAGLVRRDGNLCELGIYAARIFRGIVAEDPKPFVI